MTVYEIDAPGGVVRFARIFIRRRLMGFTKDVRVCLQAPGSTERAFMPMLSNTIGLLDLFSGLYHGHLRGQNEAHLVRYLRAFGPRTYDEYLVNLLYIVFRHKLAHLSHPYVGFNTAKESKLESRPMRLGWSITSNARREPIRIIRLKRAKMPILPIPWKLKVDHVVEISIQTLADDAIATTANYFRALKADTHLQDKFRLCMNEFYQT